MNVWRQRQSELAGQRGRAEILPAEFGVGDAGQDRLIVSVALRELQSYLYEKELVLLPSDRLDWVLGMDPDEATDAMERVVVRLDCKLPEHPHQVSELATVSDFVREVRAYVATQELDRRAP